MLACLAGGPGAADAAQQAGAAKAPPAAQAAGAVADSTPLHYQLTITPDFGTATFDGDLTIDLRVERPTTRITLDAVDLTIHRADISLPYERTVTPTITTDAATGTVTFAVPTRLYPGMIKLHVGYAGKLRSDGRGFYLVRAGGREYLVSQMEATDARRAFPCVDNPAYKASFALSAVVDRRLTAVSNGKLVSDTPGEKFGTHVLRFSTTPRMSTYLVALAVGDFACVEGASDSTPIRVCTAPEAKDRAAFVLEAARRAFQFDAQYFTFKYPFRKLDLLAVPGGFPGAMENSGAIFFDDHWLVDSSDAPEGLAQQVAVSISHEIAHQWLGNVVTMRWWDDLWLNEGMATWLAPKAVAAWKPEWRVEMGALAEARKAMRMDAFRSARPVRAAVATEAEIEESFDAMAYEKAGAVLRMVEAWTSPETFRNAVNAFIRGHAYENATSEDLWREVSAAAGKPADLVLRGFLTQPGIPLVAVESACDGDETVVTASVRRYTLDPGAPPLAPMMAAPVSPQRAGLGAAPVPTLPQASPWAVPLQLRGVNATAPMLVSKAELLTEPRQTFRIGGCFPAVLADSGALGYFHVAYRPDALAQFFSLAASRLTPAERVRLLDDQWAMAQAGTESIGVYLSLAAALAADTTPEVVETIAEGLGYLRERVVGEPARVPFESWVQKTWRPMAATLGWQPTANETADRRRARAAVLGILGDAGRDAAVLTMARTLIAADLSGAQRVDRGMLPAVRRLAARTADAEMLEKLSRQDPVEVLSSAGDAPLVTRMVESAMKKTANQDDLPALIAAALANPAVNVQVWNLVKSRWPDVEPTLGAPFALSVIVGAAGSFCDAATREDVKQFFADKTATTARTLQLTLDRIDACRDFRLRQETALGDWLKKP